MSPVRVGIDLAPASQAHRAPGTARHVFHQTLELFRLDVPWRWVPVAESRDNPLWPHAESFSPILLPGRRFFTRAVLQIGPAWRRAGCRLGFATTSFPPLCGPPFVVNVFDSNLYEHGSTWIASGQRARYYLNRWATSLAIRHARRVFTLSKYCKNRLAAVFPRHSDKFSVIPCGTTDLGPPAPAAPVWARDLSRPFFLYAGTFSENKNQRRLLEAWSQLQSLHADLPLLVLLGPCPADYGRDIIQPLLQRAPRPRDILQPGHVTNAELAWAYAHAIAYVQPSIAEGFGLPVVEAMRAGLPVACSNTTSLPEVGGDAVLYFDPFDPASLRDAVTRLWTDEPLRRQLAARGHQQAARFTWKKSAALAAAEIEAVLASR